MVKDWIHGQVDHNQVLILRLPATSPAFLTKPVYDLMLKLKDQKTVLEALKAMNNTQRTIIAKVDLQIQDMRKSAGSLNNPEPNSEDASLAIEHDMTQKLVGIFL